MYSLFTTSGPASISQGNVVYGRGLSDMMDKFLVLRRNAKDLESGTEVILANAIGRTLRKFTTAKDQAPALKLSEAMLTALDSAATDGLVLGQSNTVSALERKGLVSRNSVGRPFITDLGRQYRRV